MLHQFPLVAQCVWGEGAGYKLICIIDLTARFYPVENVAQLNEWQPQVFRLFRNYSHMVLGGQEFPKEVIVGHKYINSDVYYRSRLDLYCICKILNYLEAAK